MLTSSGPSASQKVYMSIPTCFAPLPSDVTFYETKQVNIGRRRQNKHHMKSSDQKQYVDYTICGTSDTDQSPEKRRKTACKHAARALGL